MQIDLKGNIVILDEAHNVEDMCREAASVTLRDDEIAIAAKECQDLFHKMQANGCERHIYTTLQEYLTDIVKFLKNIDVEENVSIHTRLNINFYFYINFVHHYDLF